MKLVATVGDAVEPVEIVGAGGRYRVTLGGAVREVDARLAGPGIYSLLVSGASYVADVTEGAEGWVVDVGDETYVIRVEEEARHVIRTKGGAVVRSAHQAVVAPLPGKVTHVAVGPGDVVAAGDTLLVIEAMKMENELRARAPGTVREVHVRAGQTVNAGDVLVVVD